MHPAVLLIGLAAFGATVPLPHETTEDQAMNMVHDAALPKVETYAEYGAYYTDYGNYASQDAKMDSTMAKRTKLATYIPYSSYGCYPGASVEDVANMKKQGYACYDSYGTYSAAVDEEGSKMDKMMARRHMMMTDEEMAVENNGNDMMPKRDMSSASDTEERKAPHESLPDNENKYQAYDPYTEYGHYSAVGGGEGVDME